MLFQFLRAQEILNNQTSLQEDSDLSLFPQLHAQAILGRILSIPGALSSTEFIAFALAPTTMIRERGVGEKMLIQMIAKAIYDDDGETAALDPSEDKWFYWLFTGHTKQNLWPKNYFTDDKVLKIKMSFSCGRLVACCDAESFREIINHRSRNFRKNFLLLKTIAWKLLIARSFSLFGRSFHHNFIKVRKIFAGKLSPQKSWQNLLFRVFHGK